MATLRGLIERLGGRGAARALENIGVNQRTGGRINERYLREATRGRMRDGKLVPVRENERYINDLIRNTPYRDLPDPGEAQAPSGAETHGTIQAGYQGGYWIGEQDTRARDATRELSKYELLKLLRQAPLRRGMQPWLLKAHGVWIPRGKEGESGWGESDVAVGGAASKRGWLAVAVKPAVLFYDPRVRATTDWTATEAQLRVEIAEVRRSYIAAGLGGGKLVERHVRAMQRGETFNGVKYPSFAARFVTQAGGSRQWLNVHAVEVRYPR